MPTPQVLEAAASTRSEADARTIRALAIDLAKAQESYRAIYTRTLGKLTTEERADLILEMDAAERVMGNARLALTQAQRAQPVAA